MQFSDPSYPAPYKCLRDIWMSFIAKSSSWREQAPKRKRASTNAQVFFYSYGVSSLKMKKNPNMSNFWRIKFFHQMFKVQVFLKGHKIWLHLPVRSGMLEGSKIREGGWVFLPPKQYIPPPVIKPKSPFTQCYISAGILIQKNLIIANSSTLLNFYHQRLDLL